MFGSYSGGILRRLIFCCMTLVCFALLLMLYLKATGSWLSVCSSVTQVTLIWKWSFGGPHHLDSCKTLYGIEGCHLTDDWSFCDRADEVKIWQKISNGLSNLPKSPRPPFQQWVWMNVKSPSNSKMISDIDHLINLIENSRQDTTLFVPYGSIVPSEGEDFVLPNKSMSVCWISNVWNDSFASIKYYNELKNHIEIYTAGRAFHKPVSPNDLLTLISSCKFYLSFEKSIHQDYVTEELYNPLIAGTIPVVLGPSRQNYENFVPGDAVIHVNDFFSPKDLADFLLMLGEYDDMYRRYFVWRKHYKVNLTIFGFEWQ
ncbi:alpha-(1,3)-fucosyltransferase 9-like [Scleropages formosus]|uniref:alpha-(1,3)-fucosyltransferase 9-like n=1 Tax=Scleropages formosus TaxID=113540 RepID=UPI0010FAA54E|nr:alpha-(1,3)-fucosyltransferase 9-like [Scleropages formosus]